MSQVANWLQVPHAAAMTSCTEHDSSLLQGLEYHVLMAMQAYQGTVANHATAYVRSKLHISDF